MASGRSGISLGELLVIVVVIVILMLVFLPALRYSKHSPLPSSCSGNLKQWSVIFSMYAQENRWRYPAVHGFESFAKAENAYHCDNVVDDFDFCPDLRAVFPDYATDLSLLVCPESPYLKPPASVGPLTFGSAQIDAEALGVVSDDGTGKCAYEGLVTDGDICYTYLGWQLNQPDTGGAFVDEETARRLALPVTGPSEIAAILAHIDPNRPRRERFEGDGRGKPDLRDENIDLPMLFPPDADLKDLFPPVRIHVTDTISNTAPPVLFRLWSGFYLSETEEGKDVEAKKAGQLPPVRDWHAATPIMWDTVRQDRLGNPQFTHRNPDGVNVLYMDGHVEFVEYPGKFPAAKEFATMERVK